MCALTHLWKSNCAATFSQTESLLSLWKIPPPLRQFPPQSACPRPAPLSLSLSLSVSQIFSRSLVQFGFSSGGLGMRFGKIFPGLGRRGEGPLLPSVPSSGRGPWQRKIRFVGPPRGGKAEGRPFRAGYTPWLLLVGGSFPPLFASSTSRRASSSF